jgi:hypothetical protein
MQLDSSRNHIILVNLWLSMINISVMGTTILPAFFGMNLASGLSDESTEHFYYVSAMGFGGAGQGWWGGGGLRAADCRPFWDETCERAARRVHRAFLLREGPGRVGFRGGCMSGNP